MSHKLEVGEWRSLASRYTLTTVWHVNLHSAIYYRAIRIAWHRLGLKYAPHRCQFERRHVGVCKGRGFAAKSGKEKRSRKIV